MADARQLAYLQSTAAEPAGRRNWADYKRHANWIDLSGGELGGLALRAFDLSETNLSSADLRSTDLTGALLTKANLKQARGTEACLRDATLDEAVLAQGDFAGADFSDARMGGISGFGTNFFGANLIGVDLAGADLREADLRSASLKYARLSGALLDGANVEGADMTGCMLDPDAPERMLHFDRAVIDDRRYRTMRNKFNSLFGEPDEQEATDAGLPELAMRKKRKAAHAAAAAAEKRVEESSADVSAAGESDANSSPHASVESTIAYDLTTVEGCCAILDVPINAPIEQIVKAFRKKAKIYHPDKVRHLNPRLQDLAGSEFRRLHEAYELLTRGSTRSLDGVVWAPGVPKRPTPYDYTSAEYEQLVRYNSSNTSIIYNLAWKYFEEGRPYDAKIWFEKLLELNPEDREALYNMMVVRLYLEVQAPLLGG